VTAKTSSVMKIAGDDRHRALVHQAAELAERVGQARGDAGEDQDRDAVAEAALGDLLAEPHQEHRPGDEADDRGQAKAEARRDDEAGRAFERQGDAERLERARGRACRSACTA
jgi:hypothetical protein